MLETFTAHRPMLFGVAYRMLGSIADAEDMLQETYVRWQEQKDTAKIRSPKAWLIATTTRLCIDRLRSARRTREEYVGVWLPEPLVADAARAAHDTSKLAESLSMAFLLMLETLSPVERAVFLLREAFDYDYAEIAAIVGRTETACRKIVSRAKRSVAGRPRRSSLSEEKAEQLVHQFITTTQTGALSDLLAMLTDDVVLFTDGGGVVSAARRPIVGADRVARLFVGIRRFASTDVRVRFTTVNGRVGALVEYAGRLDRVISVEFDGDRVRAIYIVRNPRKLTRIGTN